MAIDRAAPRRPLDGGGRRAHAARRVLHGRDRRRRLEDRELRHHVDADLRRPDGDRIDWRDRRLRFQPERHLRRHGQRGDPIERDPRARRVQVHRCWQHVAVRGAEGRRADRPVEGAPEEPGHRVCRGDRQPVRMGTRARRVPHERRRQDVAEGALHQRSDRRRVGRDQLGKPQRGVRGRLARAAQAVDDHQRRSGGRRRRLQDDRRRRPLGARERGIPRRSRRQGVGGRRAIEPEGRVRAGRSAGRAGRSVSVGRRRRGLDARQQQPAASSASVLLQQSLREPEERQRRVGDGAVAPSLDRRRQDVRERDDAPRRQPRRLVQSRSAGYTHRDQRRGGEHHAGRRAQLVDREQSADGRDVSRRRRRAVSLSHLRTAAGHRQEPDGPESAAHGVGTRRSAAALAAGTRLRERAGAADSVGQDRVRRLQGRVRPHERRDGAGAGALDQPAAALRKTTAGHDVPLRAAGADRNRRAQPEHCLPRLSVRAQDDRRRRALVAPQPGRDGERPRGSRDIGRADHARHDG